MSLEIQKMEHKINRKVIVIDNYDSFTYNLVHIIEEYLNDEVEVVRNDEIDFAGLNNYTHIILSPGPGVPDEAGDLKLVIEKYGASKKILGVCLGLQAIGEVYGGQLKNLDKVFHGVSSEMYLTDYESPIFSGIDKTFEAGRYHSWVIDKNTIPAVLQITAIDKNEEIMAVQHVDQEVFGVQFHPESIMTPEGKKMIGNFLEI
jgi:anthranilate synthase component 2